MDAFALLSLMLVTAGTLAWVNRRLVHLPTTIGVMVVSLGMSLVLVLLQALGLPIEAPVADFVARLDLGHAVLDVMLAFLLFAGSLHIEIDDLLGQKRVVGLLATVGVVVTTLLVGLMVWALGLALELHLPLLHALVFGALIAPTDPIAVLALLKRAEVPHELSTKIAGESLFNDGIGVVVFTVLVAVAGIGGDGAVASPGTGGVLLLLLEEVGGSIVLGLACGWVAYRMLRAIDDYHVEVLLTLALCMGLYSLASALHASGPLAVVVAGLLIGNTGRAYAMSQKVREHVDTFWELIDEILNVVLFVLLGMEVLLVRFPVGHVLVGLAAIPLVLLARFASVGGTVALLRPLRPFTPHTVKILTWGGLRGAISIALALSLDPGLPSRNLILTVTYIVVVFSIVVQGLTITHLLRLLPGEARND